MSRIKDSISFIFEKKYGPFALLLLLTILYYWQISFLQYSLKWDIIDCYLPWRYHIGECLQNNVLPFWNPYQHFGYPAFADMHSQFFLPVWIIGSTFGYSNLTFHFVIIFYIFLAGAGMFLFSGQFVQSRKTAFLVAVIYIFSGFFVGKLQELSSIAAAAYIPFILHYFLLAVKEQNKKYTLLTVIFLYLQLNGGYQAFTIILFYLLLTFFLYYLIQAIRIKDWLKIRHLIRFGIVVTILTLLTILPTIVAFIQSSPYVDRFSGLAEDSVSMFPFSPQSLISLILPFSTVKNPEFFNTDISMTNLYVGILPLLFFIIGLRKRVNGLHFIILIFGLFCLLASFGDYLPLRKLTYSVMPFMDMFRGSAYFRLFALIAIVLTAGISFERILSGEIAKRTLKIVVAGLFLVFVGIIIIVLIQQNIQIGNIKGLIFNFFEAYDKTNFYDHIFVQAVIQVIFLTVFFLYLYRVKKISWALTLTIILIDLFISLQFNIMYTGVSKYDPVQISNYLQSQPDGLPLLSERSNSAHKDGEGVQLPLWKNTNIITKQYSYDGFNSFALNKYAYMMDNQMDVVEIMNSNPECYIASSVHPLSEMKAKVREEPLAAFIEDSIFMKIPDSENLASTGSLSAINIRPNEFSYKYKLNSPGVICLKQSDFPGWKAKVDYTEVERYVSNGLFQAVFVPSGEHSITFTYSNTPVLLTFLFSSALFLLLVAVVLSIILKGNKTLLIITISVFGILLITLIGARMINQESIKSRSLINNQALVSYCDSISDIASEEHFFIVDSPDKRIGQFFMDSGFNTISLDLRNSEDRNILSVYLDTVNTNKLYYYRKNTVNNISAEILISQEFAVCDTLTDTGEDYFIIYRKDEEASNEILVEIMNFESPSESWSYSDLVIDTVISFSGEKCQLLGKDLLFSSTLSAQFRDESEFSLLFSAWVRFEAEGEAFIVVSRELSGEVSEYYSEPIKPNNNFGKWQKVTISRTFTNVDESETFKCYLWDKAAVRIFTDDLVVRVAKVN